MLHNEASASGTERTGGEIRGDRQQTDRRAEHSHRAAAACERAIASERSRKRCQCDNHQRLPVILMVCTYPRQPISVISYRCRCQGCNMIDEMGGR